MRSERVYSLARELMSKVSKALILLSAFERTGN